MRMAEPRFQGLPQAIQEPHLSPGIGARGQGPVCTSLAPHLQSPEEDLLLCFPLSKRPLTCITDGQILGCLQFYKIQPTPSWAGKQAPLLLGSLCHLPSFGFSVSCNPAFLFPTLPPSKAQGVPGVPHGFSAGGTQEPQPWLCCQLSMSWTPPPPTGPRIGDSTAYSAVRWP